jgi:hypothetical protein
VLDRNVLVSFYLHGICPQLKSIVGDLASGVV